MMNFLTGALAFEAASRSASPTQKPPLSMDITNHSQQSCSTRTAPIGDSLSSSDSDDDDSEHTLVAFGDISLTNAYFVPGIPSDISPVRVQVKRGKIQRPFPPSMPRLPALMKDQPPPAAARTPRSPAKDRVSVDGNLNLAAADLKTRRSPQLSDASTSNLDQTVASQTDVKRNPRLHQL
ncbi:hypothetical protein BD779DRAFT_649933 [Infundibulicybe gibba]|nr:hypothetical protein BD779DRAFT_649933 [Infundibulicybe gibba]